jgi:hypothetical protein
MNARRTWAIYGALLVLAAGLGLANRSVPAQSTLRSTRNPGAAGLMALHAYLEEGGDPVERLDAPFTELPPRVRTLVVAAPVGRPIGREEVDALDRFVTAGGTLVYLSPPSLEAQPGMTRWLELEWTALVPPDEVTGAESRADLGGVAVEVWVPPAGAADLRTLRVGLGPGLASSRPEAIPVAGRGRLASALRLRQGSGEIWVFASSGVAENRRIELADNLGFWAALAGRGPMAFDEYHHAAAEAPPVSAGLLAFAAQALFFTAAYAFSRGARLGPPRPEVATRHRSIREYVESMAWLIRRARVEPELAGAQAQQLRHAMHDRAGVSPSLGDEEAALQLELRTRIPRERTAGVLRGLRQLAARRDGASPREYLRWARAAAELERALDGRET